MSEVPPDRSSGAGGDPASAAGGSGPFGGPFGGIVGWVDAALCALAGLVLFTMMVITAIDVIGRYFFNAPLGGAFEVTQILMAALVFTALPPVTLRRQHITIGLIEGLFRGRMAHTRDLIVAAIVTVSAAYLAWRLWLLAERFAGRGDETASLAIPLAPVAFGAAVAVALVAAAGLVLAVVSAGRLASGAPVPPPSAPR
jgi:TRAP-type C4-dicarboxylate transport system permease small subunit